jgi:hypothetical protein
MFKSIKKFFGFGDSATTEVSVQEVPYKVETAPVLAPVVVVEAIAPVAPVAPVVNVPTKPKKPAAKKAPAKAPAAARTAAKKPAAPKAVK